MVESKDNTFGYRLLSDSEKKAKGWDQKSFAKRMVVRLKKVRGEAEDNFLMRHQYISRACAQS